MSDQQSEPEDAVGKKSKKPIVLTLILTLAAAGVGFYLTWGGIIFGGEMADNEPADTHGETLFPDVAFVPIQPLTINLSKGGVNRFLRFQAQLEVTKAAEEEVTLLLPRVTDVLNSYLRAVSTAELEDPTALVRIRAQMLRRVQVVTGDGRVRDLLVMEFVLS